MTQDPSKTQTLQRQAPGGEQEMSEEARLEEAMKRLNLLHIKVPISFSASLRATADSMPIQCRMLRETLPRMLDPLVTKQPSRTHPFSPL